jgi:competence ComEA-like helix-hairpin-helix protein
MKKALSFALGLASCALVASTLIAAGPLEQAAAQAPAGAAAAADDPDTPLFSQTCNRCHDGARITAVRRTAAEWEDVILKMIEKGAMGSEKDFETIHEYLLRNFGKVNINAATSAEITKILHLSGKDAAAIVTYRTANGPFADFDAVKKVPDIDVRMLDEHKDAVAF